MRISIRRGLPITLPGSPVQEISEAPSRRIALFAEDYAPMRGEIAVAEGEDVLAGTPLWRDRDRPAVSIVSPVSGKVVEILKGPRRKLDRMVIEARGTGSVECGAGRPASRTAAVELMSQAGLWPAWRERPFERIPDPAATPDAIFVALIDTRPHAADPRVVTAGREDDLAAGLAVLPLLCDGPLFLCHGAFLPQLPAIERLRAVRFGGPHPAGLVGTHIARLFPLRPGRRVWHIGYQEVIALGHLVRTGRVEGRRIVSLSGPGMRNPRLVRIAMGADLHELMSGDLTDGPKSILSGALVGGRESQFLRRRDCQATAVGGERRSRRNWFLRALRTAARPSPLIPTQAIEQAVGVDVPVVPLLRALSIGDAASARRLGCLQLAEEDLSLATYVTGGSPPFEPMLRSVLDTLAEEA